MQILSYELSLIDSAPFQCEFCRCETRYLKHHSGEKRVRRGFTKQTEFAGN